MEIKEFFLQLKNCEIDVLRVEKLQEMYNAFLPDMAKGIISFVNESLFMGNYRVMSYAEILDAQDELHVPFVMEGMIPFVDCMDNDFIVYDFLNQAWTKYNVVERCQFGKMGELEQLMK